MLGLLQGTVKLRPHDEAWHQLFAEEATRLRNAMGGYALAIEHVGSTAVCGLSAKPIIDIAVAVREIADAESCVLPLEKIGYAYRGEQGIPGRHFFTKGETRTHHLHLVATDSDLWKNHLLFRDYLRQNPGVAAEYETLKTALAFEYEDNREAYTEGKAAFIESVLRMARARIATGIGAASAPDH